MNTRRQSLDRRRRTGRTPILLSYTLFLVAAERIRTLNEELDDSEPELQSDIRPLVPLYAVPWLALTVEWVRFLPLNSRAAYVLSLVDGQCNVETILDMCQIGREETLALLAQLLQLGAIELRDP